MKKWLAAAIIGIAAIAAFAGTCVVRNVSLTSVGSHDVFAGELANSSGVNILQHQFRVSFLDSNGNVVETQTVSGCLRSVQDGASDFFSAKAVAADTSTSVGLARLANFAEDPNFRIGAVAASDITITVTGVSRAGATLTVSGSVENNSSTTLADPAVCAVVYDNGDRVVVTGKDESLNSLGTGASDTFSITITVPDDTALVDHVDLWTDGLSGDSTGTPVRPQSDTDNSVVVGTVTPTTPTVTNTPAPTATNTPDATQTAAAAMTATAAASP